MNKRARAIFAAVMFFTGAFVTSAWSPVAMADGGIETLRGAKHRAADYALRDRYRHPAETLEFMGLKPDMTAVEIWPGGGWYTELLAPYLREKGTYYAAHFPADAEVQYYADSRRRFDAKLKAQPAVYDKVKVVEFFPSSLPEPALKGQADIVMTFRNVHNWMKGGYDKKAFAQFYQMLKPGGVLGVVEHRAPAGTEKSAMIESGYVTEDHVIAQARAAGFKLEAKSEINANPKDSAKHPRGVWTLPPSLRLGETDREKYLAIGESDRMTLKFRKPQ